MIIDFQEFLNLRRTLPVVDVRSENEFQEGHIPGALNIPVLNNSERTIVGTTYKKQGQQEAIRAGFKLVGPRLHSIIDESSRVGPEFVVHCWRGGMRSSNYCQFVEMAGMKTFQLKGGYKRYRSEALRAFQDKYNLIILSGFTGSGKTELLRELATIGEQVIDLESLASHKGSAFGGIGQRQQPTSEQFQNNLFEELLKLDRTKPVWIEDESLAIGRIFLPVDFWKTMNGSPVLFLDVPRNNRLERLVAEYGSCNREHFLIALKAITKRLGGQHYNRAKEFVSNGDMHGAIDVILEYYDKAYAHGFTQKRDRIKLNFSWTGSDFKDIAQEISALVQQATR